MSNPHPVYRDGDHLYTICRDGDRYGIAMIPIAQGLRGAGHIIATDYTKYLPGALFTLRQLAKEAGLTKVTKTTREVAPSTDGRGKNSSSLYTAQRGAVKHYN